MAAGTFTVATDAVEHLAGRVDTLAGQMDTVAHDRYGYAGHSDEEAMEHGLHEFFHKWSDGLIKIRKELEGVGKRLHLAAGAYDAVEQAIVKAETPKR